MEWWQTLVVALASPVLPTGALFLQQRRAHGREDRIRAEDRRERAHDRWRNDRLAAHALLLVRLNHEMDAFRDAVEAVVGSDTPDPDADAAWQDDALVQVEEALAPVLLVGSVHAVGTAEHAYTQLLLARTSLAESRHAGGAASDAATAHLSAERQALFDAITAFREAARADSTSSRRRATSSHESPASRHAAPLSRLPSTGSASPASLRVWNRAEVGTVVKGIIFNLFEEMVTHEQGERAWDDLLGTAQVEGGYSSLGSYPDDELLGLAHARSSQLERSETEVMRAFGHYALLGLAQRFPQFFAPHRHTRDFLLTLNDVIHAEVRKLHADATPPEFEFDASRPDSLVIGYRSERRLCGFAEGMIAGAGAHFGETVRIVQERCMLSGADACLLHCTFHEASEEPSIGP